MYDKSSNLRIETTINNASALKIVNTNPNNKTKWLPMGKSISNLYRYAEIARSCNKRYLDSLSSVKNNDNIGGKVEKLCHSKDAKLSSKSAKPRRYSGFNLLTSFTIKLFNAVLSGQFVIRGFRNKDLREALL